MRFLAGFAGGQVPASLLMWQKTTNHAVRLHSFIAWPRSSSVTPTWPCRSRWTGSRERDWIFGLFFVVAVGEYSTDRVSAVGPLRA
ncbi:hypothetical protein BDV06DRAFT_197849 [Aspergillus oleicola]